MQALQRYLAELASHLPPDPALRQALLAEVEDHLQSRAAALQAQGLGEEESMRRATEQFGDARQVGEALARVHRRGTWRQALAGGLPHALAGLTAGLPVLLASLGVSLLGWARPLYAAFGVLVVAILAIWGRRRVLWACSWAGYGLLFVLGVAVMPFLNAARYQAWLGPAALVLWMLLAALVYLWLAQRDRLGAVLAALALVPVWWTILLLDEVAPAIAAPLVAAAGLLTALASGAAIRLGDERRGITLLAAANALIALPVTYVAIFHGQYPALLPGFGGRITAASASVSAAVYLTLSTILLLGPLWFHAALSRLFWRRAV